jgi:PAS domain S-box-containing protein
MAKSGRGGKDAGDGRAPENPSRSSGSRPEKRAAGDRSAAGDSVEAELRRELEQARRELQHTHQQAEALNEELKASNEELLAMNEELATSNDELQESRRQIQDGLEAMGRAHNDLENLLASSQIATVFLDLEGRIRNFTPAAAAIYNLMRVDIGRPISHLSHHAVEMPPLPEVANVVRLRGPLESRIATTDGRAWIRRAHPYRLPNGNVQGLVLTFTDITDLVREQAERAKLAAIVESSDDAILGITLEGTITAWNRGAQEVYGYTAEEAIGRPIAMLIPPDRIRDEGAILDRLRRGDRIDHYETVRRRKDGSLIDISLTVSPIRDDSGAVIGASKVARDITARTRIEAALRESEERFRLATQAGNVGVWDWDIANDSVAWSESLYRIHGIEPASFSGTVAAFAELVHPDDRQRVSDAIRRSLEDGTPYEIEFRAVRPDGSVRWIHTTAQVMREGGRPTRMLGGTVDITEQKQVEEALRDREERYELVLEGAEAAIWDWDVAGGRVVYSPRWKELRGLGDAEVTDSEEEWSRRIHPEDLDRVMAAVRDHFEGRTPVFAQEYRIQHKDGRWIWILDRGIARRDAVGNVVRMAGSETDITARKRAELATAESEARFRTVANASPVLIWMAGTDKKCTWFNQGWLEFTGRAMEEEIGDGWAERMHPDDFERCVAMYVDSFDRRESFEMEYRLRHKSGVYRWILDRGLPLHQPDGTFVGYIGGCVDIHERRAAEEGNRILAEAGAVLAGSLEPKETLQRVAALLVPAIGDWCAIDLKEPDGSFSLAALANTVPGRAEAVRALRATFPSTVQSDSTLARVVRSGKPEVVSRVTDDALRRAAVNDEHFELLRGLRLQSALVVPLVVRGESIGGITVVTSDPARLYSGDDLPLIEEIARRAAQVIDNARLFEELRSLSTFNEQIVESSRDCLMILDRDGRIQWISPSGRQLLELESAEAGFPESWQGWWRAEEQHAALEALQAAAEGQDSRFTGMAPTRHGVPRWWDVILAPIDEKASRPRRLLAVARDVTERIRWEEQQRLLLAELSHRVKNTLATVQSIAMQTMRTSSSMEQFTERFQARLLALSAVHGLLLRGQWRGANVYDLVKLVLQPYLEQGSPRAVVSGPPITLRPHKALALHLCLHELATNAVKHGALRDRAGSLTVSWDVDASTEGGAPIAKLIWEESIDEGAGGRALPAEGGFGLGLIRRLASYELEGDAQIDFTPDGARCVISFETDREQSADDPAPEPPRRVDSSARSRARFGAV